MIFVIGDLHLSFSTEKPMDCFGEAWKNHHEKIRRDWMDKVADDDVVMLAGDISWAMRYEDARVDFAWIDALPGRKVVIKGNHDYWWSFKSKLAREFQSIFFVNSNHVTFGRYAFVGTRGWDIPDSETGEDARIYLRELVRLENSLRSVPSNRIMIGMIHYPPVPSSQRESTEVTRLFKKYGVRRIYYGHLHSAAGFERAFEGVVDDAEYHLISCDYRDFRLTEVPCGSFLDVDDTDFEDAAFLLERRLEGIFRLERPVAGVYGRGALNKSSFIDYNYELAKITANCFRDPSDGELEVEHWQDQMEETILWDEEFLKLLGLAVRMAKRGVRSVADGIIKYNYINALAKKNMADAEVFEFSNLEKCLSIRRASHFLYEWKDRVTEGICAHLVGSGGVESSGRKAKEIRFYRISMRSDALSGRLYEISACTEEKLLLHTASEKAVQILRDGGFVEEDMRESAISSYVNAMFL